MNNKPLTTKEATDKIVAYLKKLNDSELGRISSEIKRIRANRRNALSCKMKFNQ